MIDPESSRGILGNGVYHPGARPLKVVKDPEGGLWICDKDVDPSGDLAEQGCWRCEDLPFTRND